MAYFTLQKAPHNCLFLTLTSPQKNNCITPGLIAELSETLDVIAKDADTHTLILRGEGKHFCAGADLSWMQETATLSAKQNKKDALGLANMLYKLYNLPQLTIAQVHGAVYGGGVGIAACADLVLADAHTKFCFAEVKIGLIPATISPYIVKAMGTRMAKRYFMTAEIFDAETAKNMGLVSEITQGDADARLNELIEVIAKAAPNAKRAAKKLVTDIEELDIDKACLELTATRLADIRSTDEAQEGLKAFFEKRQASWIK